jgi:hypothetical protein
LIESKTIEVIQSVGRQQDESNSCGMEFVKMDTAIRELQHLDTGQMRDELSTLGKVLYKTLERKLLEQHLMADKKTEYDEAAMGLKYDEIITTGDNVFKTRNEMVEQHMADMRMKYDEAITMRNMEMKNDEAIAMRDMGMRVSEEDKDYVSELPQHTEKPRPFLGGGRGIIDRDIVWSSSLPQTKCYVAFLLGPEVR